LFFLFGVHPRRRGSRSFLVPRSSFLVPRSSFKEATRARSLTSVRAFLAELGGLQDMEMALRDMEGYDEVIRQLLRGLTPKQRLEGLTPEEIVRRWSSGLWG
jgi:hypothetical protein